MGPNQGSPAKCNNSSLLWRCRREKLQWGREPPPECTQQKRASLWMGKAFPTYFPPYGPVLEPRAVLTHQQHSRRGLPQQGKQHSHPFSCLPLASFQLAESDSLSASYWQKWYKVKAENILYETIKTEGGRYRGFLFIYLFLKRMSTREKRLQVKMLMAGKTISAY